jgi:hypothetical protein
MAYELCTTISHDVNQGTDEIGTDFGKWAWLANFVAGVDMTLEWLTEKLDRKFVTAMERCRQEDPGRKREITLLKRTVLVLICVGLGITAVSIKVAADTQIMYGLLG